jgi:hypothetical protein
MVQLAQHFYRHWRTVYPHCPLLLEMGVTVTGSDRVLSPLALGLQESGARVFSGHDAQNVSGAGLVIRSSAVPDDNPEVQAAITAGIPVLKRADFLGQLMEGRTGMSCRYAWENSHHPMVAWMLTALGRDPTYYGGGCQPEDNAHAGKGRPSGRGDECPTCSWDYKRRVVTKIEYVIGSSHNGDYLAHFKPARTPA